MHIAFASRRLRAICENEAAAVEALGASDAEGLRKRLADVSAASSWRDLLAGNPRLDANERLVIDIGATRQITFTANHVSNPTKDEMVDWSKITRVKLLGITDL